MALKLFNDSGVAKLQAKDGEESITATADGAVKLYYDNAEKLATTSAGVNVTGSITADGIVDVLGGTIELNGNEINGVQVTIADDAFATFTPTGRYAGYVSVVASGENAFPQHQFSGFLFVDYGDSPLVSLVNTGTLFAANSGGPPLGTSGTDGSVTLYYGGTSGAFYLENRSGASRLFQITLI